MLQKNNPKTGPLSSQKFMNEVMMLRPNFPMCVQIDSVGKSDPKISARDGTISLRQLLGAFYK